MTKTLSPLLAVVVAVATAAVVAVPPSQAQTRTDDGSTVTADASGFTVTSNGGDFVLDLGADFQFDGRFLVGEVPGRELNTFDMRRLRPKFTATVDDRYSVSVMANFASGRATLQDAYLTTHFSDAVALQVGQFKTPVGLEFVQSPNHLLLAERGYPTDLTPLRDLGAILTGRLAGGALQYQAGVMNGVADGSNGFGDLDTKKDVVGRLFVEPVRSEEVGIGVGAGGTFGMHYGTAGDPQLPSFRTVGRQAIFRYRGPQGRVDGTQANGRTARIVPQTYMHLGPVGLLAEYALSSQKVGAEIISPVSGEPAERSETLTHQSWQVGASVVVTGENAAFGRVAPQRPFDPSRGQWGAVELAGRVQQLRIDDATFPRYADPQTQAERVTSIGGGVNWYLDANVRFTLNYVVTQAETPSGTGLLSPEQLLLTRFQVAF